MMSHAMHIICHMEKLSNLFEFEYVLNGRVASHCLSVLRRGLSKDPVHGEKISGAEGFFDSIVAGNNRECGKKGNMVHDDGGRWATVHQERLGRWKVRVRVSQKEGLEITQAYLDSSGTMFGYHRMLSQNYILARSRCKLGPFVIPFSRGFAVGGLFVPHHSFSVLQTCWFYEDGTVVSKVTESEGLPSFYRFDYFIDVYEAMSLDKNKKWCNLLKLPVYGEYCGTDREGNSMMVQVDDIGVMRCGQIEGLPWECTLSRKKIPMKGPLPPKIGIPLGEKIWLNFLIKCEKPVLSVLGPKMTFEI